MADSETDATASTLAVRRFLHADTAGCEFVGYFSREGSGILWSTVEGASTPEVLNVLTDAVQQAEAHREAAALVFPKLNSDAHLAALIDSLSSNARWIVEHTELQRGDSVLKVANVFWLNAHSERCSVLGMAPLLTMPVTRRAPYVCMFVWPVGRTNIHRRSKFPEIGIGDMSPPPSLDEAAYKAMRVRTEKRSRALNGEPVPTNATFITAVDKSR